MKDIKIEDLMADFIFNLNDMTYDMMICLEIENYEDACLYRDLINNTIDRTRNILINKNLTPMSEEELDLFFYEIKVSFIRQWCVELDIEEERAPFNI